MNIATYEHSYRLVEINELWLQNLKFDIAINYAVFHCSKKRVLRNSYLLIELSFIPCGFIVNVYSIIQSQW